MRNEPRHHNLKLQRFERSIRPRKYKIVAGVDEAGRGPLAGPVVACAVILKELSFTNKIFDSKRLSSSARQRAFGEIIKKAHVGVGIVDREIIDEKNILQATLMAIKKALDNLSVKPEYLLVDGRFKKESLFYPCRTVIKGDVLCFSIACASIVAKVVRDSLMSYYSAFYPQYGFNRNRGYYTKQHLKAIKKYGPTPIHRRSFRPIRKENDK
ncbi:MAG: ribonuclease HII [Candidatus Omnitrophica bacterium]|nr:ribonuclease HII [Candidatus Omnitrophota bacterium]